MPALPPPQPGAAPDLAIAALRYLRLMLGQGEETFMVPGQAEIVMVDGEPVALAGADVSAFIRALGLAAVNAMFASAQAAGCASFEEQLAYVTRLIDISIEAHTLDALTAEA